MTVYAIPDELIFPEPFRADPSGLLGVGGDLNPERLLLAYRSGIFPWFSEDQPILWWSPDPRMVLFPDELHVSRSLRKTLRKGEFEIRYDASFGEVVRACASIPRPGQDGTWITEGMVEAYVALHEAGWAHSAEAWRDGELVGGLYGVSVGGVFCGESMFTLVPDASKVTFVTVMRDLERWGYSLIDCQIHTDHLARFGAREIPRRRFIDLLRTHGQPPLQRGHWGRGDAPAGMEAGT